MVPPKLTGKQIEDRLRIECPEMSEAMSGFHIEDLWHGGCRIRRQFETKLLRPGGTISGPTIMTLADYAMYFAVLAAIGWVPLAVTTNLTINFLRKPVNADLIAVAGLFKLGKRLAVGEVGIRSDGDSDLVAHVTMTYSIPHAP